MKITFKKVLIYYRKLKSNASKHFYIAYLYIPFDLAYLFLY